MICYTFLQLLTCHTNCGGTHTQAEASNECADVEEEKQRLKCLVTLFTTVRATTERPLLCDP